MPKNHSAKELVKGLEDAVAYAEGKPHKGKAFKVSRLDVHVEPQAIRLQQQLTQEQFSDRYGIPLGTLRNWEQQHRAPEGPARVLLAVIEKYPEKVEEVVRRFRESVE
jgi:putative transcriptional regulator